MCILKQKKSKEKKAYTQCRSAKRKEVTHRKAFRVVERGCHVTAVLNGSLGIEMGCRKRFLLFPVHWILNCRELFIRSKGRNFHPLVFAFGLAYLCLYRFVYFFASPVISRMNGCCPEDSKMPSKRLFLIFFLSPHYNDESTSQFSSFHFVTAAHICSFNSRSSIYSNL